jgi:hypothetical protein
MRNDPKRRALEVCLQQLESGMSLAQVLELYPQWVDEVRPLLEAAQAARSLSAGIQVPQGAQARSRAQFLQVTQSSRSLPTTISPRRPWRFSMVFLALLVIAILGAVGTAAASARALPGDALYSVKLASEQTRLLLAREPDRRLTLEQSFDKERIVEVEAIIGQQRLADVDFTGGLVEMEPGTWLIGGFHVLVPPDAQLLGQVQPGIFVDVQGNLQRDGTIIAHQIRAREYDIEGKLERMEASTWVIGGITLHVTENTLVQGAPGAGSQVRVKAFRILDGSLQARLVEPISPGLTSPVVTETSPPTAVPGSQPGAIQENLQGSPPGEDQGEENYSSNGSIQPEGVRPTDLKENEAPVVTQEPMKEREQENTRPASDTHVDEATSKPTEIHQDEYTPEPSEDHQTTSTQTNHDGGKENKTSTQQPEEHSGGSTTSEPAHTPESDDH